MTTLAFDGKTLAADKAAVSGHLKHTTTKIIRYKDMRMGICGAAAAGVALIEWAKKGFDPETFPESTSDDDGGTFLLVVMDNKPGVYMYEGVANPIHFEDRYFSTGSGSHVATAAMYLGKSAVEAVELASELTTGSGRGVDFLD